MVVLFFDTATSTTNTNKITVTNYYTAHYILLNTVANNKQMYNQQEIEGVEKVIKIQQ